MRRIVLAASVIGLMFLVSCHTKTGNNVLLSRTFSEVGWERFDFIVQDVAIKEPTTYDLSLSVSFDPSYAYDHLMVSFSIFDAQGNPYRTKRYKFKLKESDGTWKSSLVDGYYHFTLPINSALTIYEPGSYSFQLESNMPITPLAGIREISIINQ